MKEIEKFRLGEYGEYIDDYIVGKGSRRTMVQVPASVGLGLLRGLIESYSQAGVSWGASYFPRYSSVVDSSFPQLTESQLWRLNSGPHNLSIHASYGSVTGPEQFCSDLRNKGFLCVGETSGGRAFVYKHDWSWYLVTVSY